MLIQPHCSAHHSTNALFPTFNLLAASLALTVCLSLTPITLDLSAPPLPSPPSPPLLSSHLPLLRFLTSSVDTCDAAALHASIHSIHEVHSCPCFCLVQKTHDIVAISLCNATDLQCIPIIGCHQCDVQVC
ncbi:hypothetical protein TcWFU_002554 [Taenia crassiceps]|uniref:Uncharacterized protein n=1 Tax=Taenia crassiceps TaxID=6207 RepID=A0ABR4Q7Z5_9CEST